MGHIPILLSNLRLDMESRKPTGRTVVRHVLEDFSSNIR